MQAMSPETTARALFDAMSANDLSAWEAKLAPGFTASYPGLRGAHGKAAALAFNEIFPRAFSDLQFTFAASARSGDTVFLSWTGTGLHTGPLVSPEGTLPPTGRRGTVSGVMVATVTGGQIVREETYWNVPDLIGQLTGQQAPA